MGTVTGMRNAVTDCVPSWLFAPTRNAGLSLYFMQPGLPGIPSRDFMHLAFP